MHLRVTTESDTYVYATSPLTIAGLEPEDFLVLALPIAVLKTADFNPFLSVMVGVGSLWLYKFMTADQPAGFLSVAFSLGMGRLLNSSAAQNIKPLRAILLWLVKNINNIWISCGLLPLPSYCNIYER